MGKIKKILENELVGGTQNTDIYPVTSTKAVYDENNERLDNVLGDLKNKIDTNSIISVHRADVSINKNVVTLGAGYYYFYKHDGVERNKNLDSPLEFTFSVDKVLTFNSLKNHGRSYRKIYCCDRDANDNYSKYSISSLK